MVQHDNAARAQDPHRVGEVTRMVEDLAVEEDEFVTVVVGVVGCSLPVTQT